MNPNLHIVTVDDDVLTASAFSDVLTRKSTVRWTHLTTRDEGIAFFRSARSKDLLVRDRPDLIVLDVQLGDSEEGGIDILKTIRRQYGYRNLPHIVMLSVSRSPKIITKSYANGAELFLGKAATKQSLRDQIEAVCLVFGYALVPKTARHSRRDHGPTRQYSSTPSSKVDAYFDLDSEIETGIESERMILDLPMLVRLKDPRNWCAPSGFKVQSQIGQIVSGNGSREALRVLQADPNVESVEASRSAGVLECDRSIPFIRASHVHSGNLKEKGDQAIIGIIDTGIDLLHEAFRDSAGRSRVIEIWDQTDSSGPPPKDTYKDLLLDYGSMHKENEINSYLRLREVPERLGRDASQHGSHVASVAAGRKCRRFAGGVAPESKIVLVVPQLRVGVGDPESVGYSRSHLEALVYLKEVARSRGLPIVINISLGMNAGAHDGTSSLEKACDSITAGGSAPGIIVVKSAGNERTVCGHARIPLGTNSRETLRWRSLDIARSLDTIELWYKSKNAIKIRLRDPSGNLTDWCTESRRLVRGTFASGTEFAISLTLYHKDNGDNRVIVMLRPGSGGIVSPGEWGLELEVGRVSSPGVVHAWVERIGSRPIEFITHQDEEITISIPGTAQSVITVGAVNSATPLQNTDGSSYGPTRDGREKPEVVAPGDAIKAAKAGTFDETIVMSGTSMAAPHVAGTIALVLSCNAKGANSGTSMPNAAQIRAALCDCTQHSSGGFTRNYGFGVVNAERLIQALCRAERKPTPRRARGSARKKDENRSDLE